LWAIVGGEPWLASLHDRWAGEKFVFVVVEPESISADARTSTLGPDVRQDQAGFLAGVAAGLASQTWDVGVPSGGGRDDFGAYLSGFTQGLRYACPRCRLDPVTDVGQPSFGIDVIGVPPSFDLAADEDAGGPWLVIAGEAPNAGESSRVAAQVRRAPEVLVGEALQRLWQGAAGEAWTFAADNSSLRTEINPEAISPGRARWLRDAEQRLADGRLVVNTGG
jgi:hypothetical protein